ncbi:MAG TPA: class II fructose-bisphosphatase [Rhizobiales bacterium]|nr:class II fructose-bisphosphatase [Hyphomicrobiales bacterium]
MLNKQLTIELARVTEAAAIAAAKLRGRGDERAADEVAVKAMRDALNKINMNGTVVIGEGSKEETELLYVGEQVGTGKGDPIDVALDPLEGNTLTAKFRLNALSVIAVADGGSLLHVPDCYMDKIAVGGDLPEGVVDLDNPPAENLKNLAEVKGVAVSDLTVCILDRPRHGSLIGKVRDTGAAINLIPDGDIAGVIHAANTDNTGIDIYMGSGGAPEGVLAAAALRCIGGQMQGRLILQTPQDKARAHDIGLEDPYRKFTIDDMASADVIFAATGVTDGSLLKGIRLGARRITTDTLVMRSASGSVRWIKNQRRRGS